MQRRYVRLSGSVCQGKEGRRRRSKPGGAALGPIFEEEAGAGDGTTTSTSSSGADTSLLFDARIVLPVVESGELPPRPTRNRPPAGKLTVAHTEPGRVIEARAANDREDAVEDARTTASSKSGAPKRREDVGVMARERIRNEWASNGRGAV